MQKKELVDGTQQPSETFYLNTDTFVHAILFS